MLTFYFSDVFEFADERYFIREGQQLSLTVVRSGVTLAAGDAGRLVYANSYAKHTLLDFL